MYIQVNMWSVEGFLLLVSCLSTLLKCRPSLHFVCQQVCIYFTVVWPCCIVTNFFIIKPTRCANFTNLFWHETVHVSDSSSVHHQEFIHCTLSNGICHTALEQDQDGTAVPSWSGSKAVYKPVCSWAGPGWNCSSVLVRLESCLQTCMTYTIAEFTVNKLLVMDRGTVRNM